MARLNPNLKRTVGTKKQYLGKIILFCEGKTEYNYFDYFAKIIDGNKIKYSHIEIEFVPAHGNARTVLNTANDFLQQGNNASKYSTYEKYLIFDCDDPSDIQAVINDMNESEHSFILLLTNLLFETWLLMHFEIVDKQLKKSEVIKRLREALEITRYTSKQKASPGIIRKIIGNGESVRNAIDNAKNLEKKYIKADYKIEEQIGKMNPYTTVHKLVEKILMEI